MRARRLLEGSTLTAESLGIVFRAFDEAWEDVSHLFPGEEEDARTRLAHAILIVATEEAKDVQQLKSDALQIFGLALRRGHP